MGDVLDTIGGRYGYCLKAVDAVDVSINCRRDL